MGAHRAGGRLRPVDARGRSPAAGAVDSNGFILPARACASHISLSERGVCRRAGRSRGGGGARRRCVGARRATGRRVRGGGCERRGRGGGETKACVHANVSLGTTASETLASKHANVSLRWADETMACVHASVSLRRPASETMASMYTFVSPRAARPFHLMSPRRHVRRGGASPARPGKAPACPGNA